MPEQDTIDPHTLPQTRNSLATELCQLGVEPGQVILLHSSLSRIGWVVGGAETVVWALLDVLGTEGTLMVPTHSTDNSEPSHWEAPPVPESWWQIVRDHMPAYDPLRTKTRQMGAIADMVRHWRGAKRSDHPQNSFAAVGAQRDFLVGGTTPLTESLGEASPLGAVYALDGHVLLLGVPHANNTSMHLAEHRTTFPSKTAEKQGAAMLVDGARQWVTYKSLAYDDEDFNDIGAAFESAHPEAMRIGTVGKATSKLMSQRLLVDFAVGWMNTNRM